MRLPAISPIPCGELEQEFNSLRRKVTFRRTARFVLAAIRFSKGFRRHTRQHRDLIRGKNSSSNNSAMGNALSEPITEKISACQSSSQVLVGSSCMQGWRNTMEDAHVHLLDFSGSASGEAPSSYYAVFDGHFNGAVAEFCGANVHLRIKENPQFRGGNVEEAFRTSCLAIDKEILDNPRHFRRSGSTGVMVIYRENKLHCANVGDSRAVASVTGRAQPLSFDHKPFKPEEEKRIQAAGGFVHMNRVNGTLAVSRGFGDSDMKENSSLPAEEQMVTASPEIITEDVTDDHEFFILACDGIWDCKSSQEVVDFVRERVAAKILPDKICEELMMSCLAPESRRDGLGCDNMTVVLGILLRGKEYEDVAKQCQRPCSPSVHAQAATGEPMDSSSNGAEGDDATESNPSEENSASGSTPADAAASEADSEAPAEESVAADSPEQSDPAPGASSEEAAEPKVTPESDV